LLTADNVGDLLVLIRTDDAAFPGYVFDLPDDIADAFAHSSVVEIEGLEIHIPSVTDLIINKRASGRTKDLADAEMLEGK